jgi:hypothetical protein
MIVAIVTTPRLPVVVMLTVQGSQQGRTKHALRQILALTTLQEVPVKSVANVLTVLVAKTPTSLVEATLGVKRGVAQQTKHAP